MRRILLLLPWLLLPACADPDGLVLISGQVVDSSGHGQGAAILEVARSANVPCVVNAHPLADGGTDGTGNFLFQLVRATTVSANGIPYCFSIATHPANTGGSSIYFFESGNDIQLPAMLLWSDSIQASNAGDGGIVLSGGTTPPMPGVNPSIDGGFDLQRYEWEFREGDLQLWAQPLSAPSAVVDSLVLEDFPHAAAGAHAMGLGTAGPFTVFNDPRDFVSESRTIPLDLPNPAPTVPVSRGAACYFDSVLAAPCPLTDGKLNRYAFPVPDVFFDAGVASIEIPVFPPSVIQTVVVRDLGLYNPLLGPLQNPGPLVFDLHPWSGQLLIEGSGDDGGSWASMMALDAMTDNDARPSFRPGQFLFGKVPVGTPAVNRVRLRFQVQVPDAGTTQASFHYLSEISLFR